MPEFSVCDIVNIPGDSGYELYESNSVIPESTKQTILNRISIFYEFDASGHGIVIDLALILKVFQVFKFPEVVTNL